MQRIDPLEFGQTVPAYLRARIEQRRRQRRTVAAFLVGAVVLAIIAAAVAYLGKPPLGAGLGLAAWCSAVMGGAMTIDS